MNPRFNSIKTIGFNSIKTTELNVRMNEQTDKVSFEDAAQNLFKYGKVCLVCLKRKVLHIRYHSIAVYAFVVKSIPSKNER